MDRAAVRHVGFGRGRGVEEVLEAASESLALFECPGGRRDTRGLELSAKDTGSTTRVTAIGDWADVAVLKRFGEDTKQ